MKITKILFSILAVFLFAMPPAMAQDGGNVTVSGVVTSAEDRQPVIGVYVFSNPANGVITDLDGFYTIDVKAGETLTYQCVGFGSVAYTVPSGNAAITYNVALENDSQLLEETVVIAYGVRKKGTIAGSVATVKSDKVESTASAAFDQALQGQVPGLTVLSNSGEPSATATMTIRGTNSINSGTAPLYILDGVAISSGDFNMINPADIESISVLKDASSTSIYGARAANGVIVITTKRGREPKPQITYRTQMGFSQIARANWNIMNTDERIRYEKEIGLTAGKNYDILAKTDVNWLEQVFNNDAFLQNHEVSIAGANDHTNYYVSGNFYDQEGTAIGSGFRRYSVRSNVEQYAAKWLKLGFSSTLNYQEIQQADDGVLSLVTPISAAQFMMPYWNPYNADGSVASIDDGTWKGDGQNPIEWISNNPVKYKKYKVFTMFFAELKPFKGFTFKTQASLDYSHTTAAGFSYPEYGPNMGEGSVSRNSTDGMSLQITNTANYQFEVGSDHSFNFLLGQEGINYHYENFSVGVQGQQSNKLTDLNNGTFASTWGDTVDDD